MSCGQSESQEKRNPTAEKRVAGSRKSRKREKRLPARTERADENQNKMEKSVREKFRMITKRLIWNKMTITTMESCTAGLIASLITDTEGASAVMKGAFVTYSNEAKIRQGVPAEVIEEYGVYSEETAGCMAGACRRTYQADVGIGVTGSFGNPDPNNEDSVPGEVFFAIETERGMRTYHCRIPPQESRLKYKLYMADLIADRLMELLKITA